MFSAAAKRILFVTAHPDDECMFFTPIIANAVKRHHVHLLCLSTGNYDGLGSIRKKELFASAAVLGIPSHNVTCIDDENLPDHPTQLWPEALIAKYVSDYVKAHDIQTIVTFDGYGVSGHCNHIATSRGVSHALRTGMVKTELMHLVSVGIIRKYLGIFDLPFSSWQTHFYYFTSFTLALRAMRAHASQLVWFRYLFLIFSRYVYMNTLTVVKSDQRVQSEEKGKEKTH